VKLSIRRRFFATAAIVSVLGLLILASTVWYARALAADTRRLETASEERAKVLAVAAESLQFIRDGGDTRLEGIRAGLREFQAAIDALVSGDPEHGMSATTDGRTLATLEGVMAAFRSYRRTLDSDLVTWAELDTHEVSAPYRQLIVERALRVDTQMAALTAALAANVERSLGRLNTAQLFAVLALVALVGISVVEINRHVLAPMPLMAQGLYAVAAGNLHARVTLAADSEFARVAEAFNRMVKELDRARQIIGQKQMEIEAKNTELERASRMKSEFLATMSHELRTPMNAIMGYTSLMRREIYGKTSEDQKKALAGIAETSSALLGLINDVLDITKVEAGLISLNNAGFDMNALAQDLLQTIRPLATGKGLDLRLEPGPQPVNITSDRARIRQIVLNLLGNAVKFTDAGGILIKVRPEGDEIVCSVSDTGIGIRPEDHEAAFETFRQLDGTDTRSQGGTGLGLSISRKLARLLGGDVELQSSPGAGSTFTLRLPSSPRSQSAGGDEGQGARDAASGGTESREEVARG
jgi:signal transduction histidine kinase